MMANSEHPEIPKFTLPEGDTTLPANITAK